MKHRDKQMCYTFLMGIGIGAAFGFGCFHSFTPNSPDPLVDVSMPSQIDQHHAHQHLEDKLQTREITQKENHAVGTHTLTSSQYQLNDSTKGLIRRAMEVERSIVSSIKSCLGAKCIDEKPKGAKVERVLVTALPHSQGELLHRMLIKLASMEKSHIDIEFTSRSLPYGYGRNFGFNRVVKLVARPLWNVAAMLQENHPAAFYEEASVLYLRWHCRAKIGHTRSLLMFSDDLVRRSYVKLEEAASFIGLKPSRGNLLKVLEGEGLNQGNAWYAPPSADNMYGWLEEVDHSPFPPTLKHDLVHSMIQAMEEEISRSKSLQSWPCGSIRGGLSPLTNQLTPNCSAPYVDCFVSHDTKQGEHV